MVSTPPVTSAVVMLVVALALCTIKMLLGVAEIEKSEGLAVTFTVTETVCVMGPSTPVTVTEYWPGATAGDAVTVRPEEEMPEEEIPAPITVWFNVADRPAGDDTDSVIGPAAPLTSVAEMLLVAVRPWGTLMVAGLAEREKSPPAKAVMCSAA